MDRVCVALGVLMVWCVWGEGCGVRRVWMGWLIMKGCGRRVDVWWVRIMWIEWLLGNGRLG